LIVVRSFRTQAVRATLAGFPASLPDDEVIATQTGIADVGVWTVNVFLIFNLARLDVLPVAISASGAACN
jgi:3-methyladenine DNA glycosylase/8-oxoguanine DNA glycosylase